MKKILKFFPVALTAIALASCSNDELFSLGSDDQPEKDPTKLYVLIEDLTDGETGGVTRSGYVYSKDVEKPNGQVFVWTKNDKVKLYDDLNNWRPQIWTYSADATIKYAQSGDKFGFAVFENNTTTTDLAGVSVAKDAQGEALPQYTNAYGVMPYDLAEFANEKRTAVDFKFSKLSFYKAEFEENVPNMGYENNTLCKAPIPLWGVANGQEMKVNYLTAILKVDIDNIKGTNATATDHNFLIIQSTNNDASDAFNLHPNLNDVAFTPDVAGAVPAVATAAIGSRASAIAARNLTAAGNDVPADQIVIDLGKASGRTCVSVPLMPSPAGVKQYVKAYLKTNVPVGDYTNVDLSGATAINTTAKEWVVAAGSYYRIQDPGVVELNGLNNPKSIQDAIIANDPLESRDWTLLINSDIDVKTGGEGADKGNYVIDLSGYTFKHNVTIAFKTPASQGFIKNADSDKLVIKTAASTNNKYSLTIDNPAHSSLKNIEIDAANEGPVVLTGDYNTATKTINVNSPLVTLKNAVATDATVNAKAELTIDNSGKTIGTLNILKGCEKVNAKNGIITTVAFVAGAANAIDADVEIATTGNAHIGTVDYANVPNNGAADAADLEFTKKINFTSVWSGVALDADATLTQITGTSADDDAIIISAAQLAGYDFTTADDVRILAKTININAADWTPRAALSGGTIDGNINVLPGTSTKTLAPVNASIEGMKKTIAGAGDFGLFADVQKNISNLQIKDVTFTGSNTAAKNIGALAGKTSTSAVILTNVDVKNISIIQTGRYAAAINIGGVVGQAAIATTLLDVTYEGVTLKGSASIGGFIGNVAKTGAATFGGAAATLPAAPANLCAFSGTNTIESLAGNYEFDPTYAKFGTYVGSASPEDAANQAVVKFYLAAAPSTTIAASAKAPYDKWTTVVGGAIKRWNINRGLNEIGFSGYTGDNNPAVANASWVVYVYIPDATGSNAGKFVEANKRSYKIDATLYNAGAKPGDYNTAGVYYLNYFNQYLQ